jgi:uncharacterized protein
MRCSLFPEPTIKGIGLAALRVVLLVYILFGMVLYVRQERMIYFPDNAPFAECSELADVERLQVGDMRAYHYRNGTSTTLAVFYHGNGDRACSRSFYRHAIEDAGYSWLFVEYTGYAGDGKHPSTGALLRDVERVQEWVLLRDPSSLVVIGESIGSGPASYHAALADDAALILIAPFDRLGAMAQERYPLYPISLMLRGDFDNVRTAKEASRVLVVHSRDDEIMPYFRAEHLFQTLPQEDKRFVTLFGLTHNDTFTDPATQDAIYEFLSE